MERRFFLNAHIESQGSPAKLNALRSQLREQNATALIEVGIGVHRRAMLLYANGSSAGIYLVEGGYSRPFNLTELFLLWGGATFTLTLVPLPDRMARSIWLLLESHSHEQFEVNDEHLWKRLLQRWREEKFSRVIEFYSEIIQGFFVIQRGRILENEAVFFNGQGYEHRLPEGIGQKGIWHFTTYLLSPLSNAWQCVNLRESATSWAKRLLSHYAYLAGQKFLELTCREVNQSIQPWNWKIAIRNATVNDDHFFPSLEATAHAYRALFMSLGTQMGFVIGNRLTQHILDETYQDLDEEQRRALQAHRLIPAAFS